MIPGRYAIGLILVALMTAMGADATDRRVMVVCAPGYPGDTEQAQPTMDAFAERAAGGAGWTPGSLGAGYFETVEGGIERMGQPDAALALVPLAFLVEFGEELGLEPKLQAVPAAGRAESWSLVAGKGRATDPRSLVGWEVASRAGYSTSFVSDVVLGEWGDLPDGARVTFTRRVVSALRKAASGQQVAVLLDGEQSAALSSLPFAPELEVVFESAPLPHSVLCIIGDRLSGERADGLLRSLQRLHESEPGREILDEMRLARFEPMSPDAVERIRRRWKSSSEPGS